jgi:hypothetical protein
VIFGKTKDLTRTKAARESATTRRLAKIVIPSASISEIQKELENAGFTISMLFPDPEHLSKELCDRWRSIAWWPHTKTLPILTDIDRRTTLRLFPAAFSSQASR